VGRPLKAAIAAVIAAALVVGALMGWGSAPPPASAPAPGSPVPSLPRVGPAAPAPVAPIGEAAEVEQEALSALAGALGQRLLRCDWPDAELLGAHPFVRVVQRGSTLWVVPPSASGSGHLMPTPPSPGELQRAGLAVEAWTAPLAAARWGPDGCAITPIREVRLRGRVDGAPGSTWLVGCGLVMEPTDADGAFDVTVPGGAPCVLLAEGRGDGLPLTPENDQAGLTVPWTPPAPTPDEELGAHLRKALDALDAAEDADATWAAALDGELSPPARATLERWWAEETSAREAQRDRLLRALSRSAGPQREPVDAYDQGFPTENP
jgi:hypothetical protein